jgi:Ubiquitin fold domain
VVFASWLGFFLFHFFLFLHSVQIATTTAAVTGLVAIEFYKTLFAAPVEKLRNTFMNLAINAYQSSEPAPPKRTKSVAMDPISMGPVKALPEGFTRWDRVIIKGKPDLTPNQLSEYLGEHFKTTSGVEGVKVSMISAGKAIIYNPLLYRSHATTRKDKPLRVIIDEVTQAAADKAAGVSAGAGAGAATPATPSTPAPSVASNHARGYLLLDVSCEDDEGDVVIPQVQLYTE